jgi:hypothetical protein
VGDGAERDLEEMEDASSKSIGRCVWTDFFWAVVHEAWKDHRDAVIEKADLQTKLEKATVTNTGSAQESDEPQAGVRDIDVGNHAARDRDSQ